MMPTSRAQRLSDQCAPGLPAIRRTLLPGTALLPPGEQGGAPLGLLDRVVDADPSLAEMLERAGLRGGETTGRDLDGVLDWLGDSAERVVFALHAAYYMAPEVRAALGYPGQQRRPVAEAAPDQRVSDALLAPVLERGPIYVAPFEARSG